VVLAATVIAALAIASGADWVEALSGFCWW